MNKIITLIMFSMIFLMGIVSAITWSDTSLGSDLISYTGFNSNLTGNDANSTFVLTDDSGGAIELSDQGKNGKAASGRAITVAGERLRFDIDPFTSAGADKSLTVAFWFNQNGSTGNGDGYGQMFGRSSTGTADRYLRNYFDDATDIFRANYAQYWGGASTANIDKNKYYHYVFQWNTTSFRMWINGTLDIDQSAIGAGAFDLSNGAADEDTIIFDGSSVTARPSTHGLMDELAIWNRTLTDNEITDLYNNATGVFFTSEAADNLTVVLELPIDDQDFGVADINFTANYTLVAHNMTNATYWFWFGNGSLLTTVVNSSVNSETNYTVQLMSGMNLSSYLWNVYACGISAVDFTCAWAVSNSSFEIGASIDAQGFEPYIYETETAVFTVNISLVADANLFAAKLVYNGTSYLADQTDLGGGKHSLKRAIDIPAMSDTAIQNITWFWNFEYRNGAEATQNTSLSSHEVNPLFLALCNTTYTNSKYVNFTFANETSRAAIAGIADVSLDFWLGGGTRRQNYSLDSTATALSYGFCSNQNASMNVSAILNIKNVNFFERTFYLNKRKYSNETTNETLYLQDDGTAIIVKVRDSDLIPLEGYFVDVERFYPELNDYKIIEFARTDEYGQFVARLIEPNTIKYRFRFKDSDNVIKKRTNDMTIACRTVFCVIPFVIEDTVDEFADFQEIPGYDSSLTFNNETNIFTFTWNDVSGDIATNKLTVERIQFNGTSIVCNETNINPSGSMTCNVGNQEASYNAQTFRMVSGEPWVRTWDLSITVGTTYATYGNEGIIWSFFFLMTAVAIGAWYPPGGIALYGIFSIIIYMTKIIYVNPAILFAELAIVTVFCWTFGAKK